MSQPKKARRRNLYPSTLDIYSRTGEKLQDEKILQPYRHMANHPSRGIIRLITNAFNYWFNVPKEKMVEIEEIFRIIYNAVLLVDDIEDHSTLRRGSPVAHSIYGAASTLVAANYATSIVLDRILDFVEAEIVHRMSQLKRRTRRDNLYPGTLDIYSGTGEKLEDEKLLQPYRHMANHPSRGIIRLITNAFNYWFNIPEKKVAEIEEIFRIIYNATLLVDDIEDRSTLRRGSPVAHSIYGAASTLAAANYATSIVLERMLNFIEAEENSAETAMELSTMIVELFRGQGMELYWRENFICPTEEEYYQMSALKSNGLFKLVATLMSSCSSRKEDFSKLNELMGVAFQLLNDYENVTSDDSEKRKAFCDDITEGKFSFPIIHAIKNHPEGQHIMDILRLGTTDEKLKRHCLNLMQECGSVEYTKQKIADFREQVLQEAKKFSENPQMDIMITFILGEKE